MKIDNVAGGSRETSTGKPARVDERGRESINFLAELKRRTIWMMDSANVKFAIGNVLFAPALAAKE
jgi:hypothetical protein